MVFITKVSVTNTRATVKYTVNVSLATKTHYGIARNVESCSYQKPPTNLTTLMICVVVNLRIIPDGSLSFKGRFVNNMLRLAAGIASLSKDGFVDYGTVNNIDYADNVWEQTAVARINVKKALRRPFNLKSTIVIISGGI